MITDYPPHQGPAAHTAGREALAVVAAVLLHPFGWIKRVRRTPRAAHQRTIVLIHGYLANPSCFAALRAYLRLNGHGSILAYRYQAHQSVESAAIGLKAFLKKSVRGGRIDFVCHSLGGLVALSYLCELGGARRVDHCITLGTPHRGTYGAYWLGGRMGRDLRPGSALLRRLHAARLAGRRVRFTAVVAGSDALIIPRIFASKNHTIVIDGLGHTGLLFSPRVLKIVADRLADPKKPPAIRVSA